MNIARRLTISGLRWCLLAALVVLVGLSGCCIPAVRLWGPPPQLAENAWPVRHVKDVPYYDGPDADPVQHSLDLFLPEGKKNFPVVMLVHGGVWISGDNRFFGLYSAVGEYLASQGIGVVLPNYRLSPWVQHPEHIKDVARAMSWTRRRIADYGGCPQEIFLAGHSAGGHLAALLVTDESYLQAEGMRVADIRGVMTISGVYRIPPNPVELVLGGTTPDAFHWDTLLPMRGESITSAGRPGILPGFPFALDIYAPVFGSDPATRTQASPLAHVRPGLPPFLILVAEKELPTLTAQAAEFHAALQRHGCMVKFQRIPKRNHSSIMFQAIQATDPTARAMLEFMEERLTGR